VVFAQEGAKVVGADINDAAGKKTMDSIQAKGGEALYVHTDVSKASDAEKLIKAAVAKFGRIDVLLNVAGIPHKPTELENIDDALWDKIYSVNVKGPFHTMKYAIPYMKKARSGAIVNVASIGGLLPRPGGSAYTSSKGALITMTRAVSLELSQYHVRANCLNPGGTDTQFNIDQAPEGTDIAEMKKDDISHFPLGRYIKPEEVAYAAVFLASDESLMMSGTSIIINQGMLC
jgi:NAD(P)-dependent dehydrogenase (short-subunit alcohol dehydrogenase family)